MRSSKYKWGEPTQRVHVTIPESLYAFARRRAAERGSSISAQIAIAAAEGMDGYERRGNETGAT